LEKNPNFKIQISNNFQKSISQISNFFAGERSLKIDKGDCNKLINLQNYIGR